MVFIFIIVVLGCSRVVDRLVILFLRFFRELGFLFRYLGFISGFRMDLLILYYYWKVVVFCWLNV